MYKYTVESYNSSDIGKLDAITITVLAADKEDAIKRAKQIELRTNYSVIGIEELLGDNRPKSKKG